jgi:hypothetical protein
MLSNKISNIIGGLFVLIIGIILFSVSIKEYNLINEINSEKSITAQGIVASENTVEGNYQYNVEYYDLDSNFHIVTNKFSTNIFRMLSVGDTVNVKFLNTIPIEARIDNKFEMIHASYIGLSLSSLAIIIGLLTILKSRMNISVKSLVSSSRLEKVIHTNDVLKIKKSKIGAFKELGSVLLGTVVILSFHYFFFNLKENDGFSNFFILIVLALSLFGLRKPIITLIKAPWFELNKVTGVFSSEDFDSNLKNISAIEISEIHDDDSANTFILKLRFSNKTKYIIDKSTNQDEIENFADEISHFIDCRIKKT